MGYLQVTRLFQEPKSPGTVRWSSTVFNFVELVGLANLLGSCSWNDCMVTVDAFESWLFDIKGQHLW